MEEEDEGQSFAIDELLVQKMLALRRSDLPPPLQKHQDSARTRILERENENQIGVLNGNEEEKGVNQGLD